MTKKHTTPSITWEPPEKSILVMVECRAWMRPYVGVSKEKRDEEKAECEASHAVLLKMTPSDWMKPLRELTGLIFGVAAAHGRPVPKKFGWYAMPTRLYTQAQEKLTELYPQWEAALAKTASEYEALLAKATLTKEEKKLLPKDEEEFKTLFQAAWEYHPWPGTEGDEETTKLLGETSPEDGDAEPKTLLQKAEKIGEDLDGII